MILPTSLVCWTLGMREIPSAYLTCPPPLSARYKWDATFAVIIIFLMSMISFVSSVLVDLQSLWCKFNCSMILCCSAANLKDGLRVVR